jgi:hypothetical protein
LFKSTTNPKNLNLLIRWFFFIFLNSVFFGKQNFGNGNGEDHPPYDDNVCRRP